MTGAVLRYIPPYQIDINSCYFLKKRDLEDRTRPLIWVPKGFNIGCTVRMHKMYHKLKITEKQCIRKTEVEPCISLRRQVL